MPAGLAAPMVRAISTLVAVRGAMTERRALSADLTRGAAWGEAAEIAADVVEALRELLPWAEGTHPYSPASACDCARCITVGFAHRALARAEGRTP